MDGLAKVGTFRRAKTVIVMTFLVFGTLVLAVTPPGQEPDSFPDWPGEGGWINYAFRGERIRDWEDKPYENDPTHGIANVQPEAVDIASGVDATGGGEENNPGDYTSVQYLYMDVDGDSSGCDNIDDDWLFLRMRVAGDPRATGGKYMYKSYHWDILLEVDGDIWSEFVVDLNGGDGYFKFGTVGVYYNDTEDYEYDPDNDWVWLQEASKDKNKFTRVVDIDYGTETVDDDQWWIEYRIPVTAFTDYKDNQLLCADSEFLLFFSTSASMTNPLQKDWMGEYVFGEPANITVEKTVEEGTVAPGDTLHYKIYYNNTGDFNANDVWINDTIPEYTTFLECYPPYNSVDDHTYRWHFTDVAPGNYTIYLNVTVDMDVLDGTILRNVVLLNYTDHQDSEQPGSEDETENPVAEPNMSLTKEANIATANPGDVIEYTITYENLGSGDAYNMVIQDTIPEHTIFQSSNPGYDSVSGRTYTWNINYVPGYSVNQILLYVTVDAYTTDQTVLENYVTLDYEDVNQNQYPKLEAWAYVTVTAPIMDVSKVADPITADPGDEITFTITYENSGTGDATDVEIRDSIPQYTTFISSDPDYDDVSGPTYIWTFDLIEGESSGVITITVKVDVGTPDGTVLTNEVTLDYDDINGNPYPQKSDTADVTVNAPIFTFSKTANCIEADPGDQIIYSITYKNSGSGWASGVYINDTIPDYTSFVSSGPGYTDVDDRTYIWFIDDVAPGFQATITITVSVDPYTPDEANLHNVATLDYADANGNYYPQMTDYADVAVTAPVMTFSKTVDLEYANPGDEITYTITYHNIGSGIATDVVIIDTIPDYTTYVSASPGYDAVSDSTYTWNIGTLLPGESGTITLIVTVNAQTPDETLLTNSATLNYNDANGNAYPEISDSAQTTVTAPIMTLSKTADVEYADPGDTITYTITYHNHGTGIATYVTIVDTIPEDTTLQSTSLPPDDQTGDILTWYIGTVDSDSGGTITITVTVDAYTPDETVLTNTVVLNYDDANGNQYDPLSDSAVVGVTAPEMTVGKVANVNYADPGDMIMYTITYSNTGTGGATNVVIEDTIPSETTFVNSNPMYSSHSGNTYTWIIGTVASGSTGYIFINVTVNAGTLDQTVLTNYVILNYDDNNSNPQTQKEDSVDVTVTAPIMTVTKTANVSEADPGDQITYTIEYENTGTGDASNVLIVDTIDPDTTYVIADPLPSSIILDVITWDIGFVASGGSGSITLTVEVDTYVADGTILTNAVVLYYDDDNGNPQDEETDSVDVTVTAPAMTITKTANCTYADPGDTIVYTITYENTGNGDATEVVIEDILPTYTTFVDADPYPDSVSGGTLTWNIGFVAKESDGTISVSVTVDYGTPDGTLLRNFVYLNYDDANGNPQNEESDYVDVTVTAPEMTFTKSADVIHADPGDTIIYTLTYENTGSGEATLVVVKDTIPLDVTFVSSDPDYDEVSGSTYTWNIGTVGAYSTGTITITVTVNVGVADGALLHNVATLDYADANGNYYPQLSDDADVTVTAPDMTIIKSANVSEADPGDPIVYTLTYDNAGSGQATNVVITDTIPEYTTFVSSDPMYDDVTDRTYTWNIGTVDGYGGGTITLTVTVDAGTADGTLLRNECTLDYDDANGNPYTQKTDYADVIVTAPVLGITKTANVDTADPEDQITYTIEFTNSGSGNATGVWINDTIPAYTNLVITSPTWDYNNMDTYIWYYDLIAPGASVTITIIVEVDVGTPDQTLLHNLVTLDYADDNGNPLPQETAFANVYVTAPIMSITKTANVSQADPGDTIIYTIEYENTGTGWASLVEVVDTIPAYTTFVSSTPSPTGSSGDDYTWTIGDLAPGASETITITVTVDVGTPDETLLHNIVTLDYADANGNYYSQLSDYADVVVTAPRMSVYKTSDVPEADPGDTIVYTIQYENSGTGWASLVKIVDTIPEDTTFVGSNPAYTSAIDDEYTWIIGDVSPGASGTITITVTVDVGTNDGTLLHNIVTLDYADANGNYYPQLDDYADVVVTAPVMHISKTGPTAATPAQPIEYTITYENSGTGLATLVEIVDVLPDYVNFVSATPSPSSVSGNTLTWYLGEVPNGGSGTILIIAKIDLVVPDDEDLINTVTLFYSDANGNSLPSESDSVTTTIEAGSIGDFVWHDENMNGIYEPTEPGVEGITVILEGTTAYGDAFFLTTTTNSNGMYLFESLPPGNFVVSLDLAWGWYTTTTHPIYVTLDISEDYLDADFGIIKAEIEKTVSPDVAKIGNILHVHLWVKSPFPEASVVDTLPPELEYIGNAIDDDGDGYIDEEKMDGMDNDGDTLIDEDVGCFRIDGNYITDGLSLDDNRVIYELPGKGIFTIDFDIIVVVDPEGEKYVTNLAEIIVDDETMAYDTYTILIRYSGFDKYFVPINDPQPLPEPGEIVVDGGTPGYYFDYGDCDGIIEIGELIFWLVEYNITNKFNYTWTNVRMEDRWGGEYGVGGDSADNDNDGLIDEEAFNMFDDDGDGKIDEDIDVFFISQGAVSITLRGQPSNSDKVYIYWDVGSLAPGETAIMRVPVYTDRNPGNNVHFPQGHQCFSSPGYYIMNSGGVLKWLDAREKQHSAHTLRLYVNTTDGGGDTAEGGYAEPASITGYKTEYDPILLEGETMTFQVELSNPSSLSISAYWYLGGELVGEGLTFEFTSYVAGEYTLFAETAGEYHLSGDSLLEVMAEEHTWNILVKENTDPIAVISSPENKATFYLDEEIIFDGSDSYDQESSITWEWVLGDVTVTSQAITTHIYENEGDYLVKLTVTDSIGQSDSSYITVYIKERRPTAFIDSPTKSTFNEGEEIFFMAHASYPGDESTLTFQWDIGDGHVYLGKTLKQAYLDDGKYTVTLTVTDTQDHEDTAIIQLTILNVNPSAEINPFENGEVGDTIHFSAQASDPGQDTLTYEWSFGDGSSAYERSVTHEYPAAGQYHMTLTVRDEDGGLTVVKSKVTISEKEQPDTPVDDNDTDIPDDDTPDEPPATDETPVDETDDTKEPDEISKRKDRMWLESIGSDEGSEGESLIPIYAIIAALIIILNALTTGTHYWQKKRRRG